MPGDHCTRCGADGVRILEYMPAQQTRCTECATTPEHALRRPAAVPARPATADLLDACERAMADLPAWRREAMVGWLRRYGEMCYQDGLRDGFARPDATLDVTPAALGVVRR